jgi:hypothetical protein
MQADNIPRTSATHKILAPSLVERTEVAGALVPIGTSKSDANRDGSLCKGFRNTFLMIAGHHRSLALRYLKQEWLGAVAQCANLSPLASVM